MSQNPTRSAHPWLFRLHAEPQRGLTTGVLGPCPVHHLASAAQAPHLPGLYLLIAPVEPSTGVGSIRCLLPRRHPVSVLEKTEGFPIVLC